MMGSNPTSSIIDRNTPVKTADGFLPEQYYGAEQIQFIWQIPEVSSYLTPGVDIDVDIDLPRKPNYPDPALTFSFDTSRGRVR